MKFSESKMMIGVKTQKIYLHESDTNIKFNDIKHIYYMDNIDRPFSKSVTKFCETLSNDGRPFIPHNIIRTMDPNQPESECLEDNDIDFHVKKLVDWKYAQLFGSMFHHCIEYFFDNYVNVCDHEECKQQVYNVKQYTETLVNASNDFNMSNGVSSQVMVPQRFNCEPIMPCMKYLARFKEFTDEVIENFEEFFELNSFHVNVGEERYHKEFVNTMELAFETVPLKPVVSAYRRKRANKPYEHAIDECVDMYYSCCDYKCNLEMHLENFCEVLKHLPVHLFCDIRPEYIAYNIDADLAGSMDLVARDRYDCNVLYIYDWKTCAKIYQTYGFGNKQTSKMTKYQCQLHTYANLIKEKNHDLMIHTFIVNITDNNYAINNNATYLLCKCRDEFLNLKSVPPSH